MAVTVTTDFVTLYDGNTVFGGGTVYTGFQRFGTGCNGGQVSNGTEHFTGTVTSFSLVGRGIYSWMVGPGSIGTIAQGGYRIVIGDGTNTRAYYVGGRDYKGFNSQGWNCFLLQGDALPTNFEQLAGAAEPNLNAITLVGIGFTTTSKAVGNSPNVFWDLARYGTGLVVGGGTVGDPGTFDDIRVLDDSLSNAWGVIERLGGGIYGIQGKLTFGSSAATSYFEDKNVTVVFEDRFVSSDYYEFKLLGSAAHTNTFILGEKSGTGDDMTGINGVTIQSPNIDIDMILNHVDVDVIGVFGSTFSGLGTKQIILSSNSTDEFAGNSVVNSGQLVLNQVFYRNNNVISSTVTGLTGSTLWNETINMKNSIFTANFNAIQHSGSTGSPYSYDALIFNNNTYDIVNTSGTGITVNAINGSNPTTFNPSGDTVTINNPTNFSISNLVPDTEVRIFRRSDRFELAGVESSSDVFTYQYNYGGDIEVYVVVHKETYEYIKLTGVILTENDQNIPVQQRFDRNYIPS